MKKIMDGNIVVVYILYVFIEVVVIYFIILSLIMVELVDEWVESGLKNIYG